MELHDYAIEPSGQSGEGEGTHRTDEIEVVVSGRGVWGHDLHVVTGPAQGAHLLERIGADAVPGRRIGADHEDALRCGGAFRAG